MNLYHSHPIGTRLKKSAAYPEEWTARECNKSIYGTVVGYSNGAEWLRVKRDGTVTPVEVPPEYFEIISQTEQTT
jgi:hypothetical protein